MPREDDRSIDPLNAGSTASRFTPKSSANVFLYGTAIRDEWIYLSDSSIHIPTIIEELIHKNRNTKTFNLMVFADSEEFSTYCAEAANTNWWEVSRQAAQDDSCRHSLLPSLESGDQFPGTTCPTPDRIHPSLVPASSDDLHPVPFRTLHPRHRMRSNQQHASPTTARSLVPQSQRHLRRLDQRCQDSAD